MRVGGQVLPAGEHERFMAEALAAAEEAFRNGEVPIGAVVVAGGRVIASGYNEREATTDPTAHAEIVALRRAAAALGGWRLNDATLYVTVEPCPMCAGALLQARVARLVYGAREPKTGAFVSAVELLQDPRLPYRVQVIPGVMADACAELLQRFFQAHRDPERCPSG